MFTAQIVCTDCGGHKEFAPVKFGKQGSGLVRVLRIFCLYISMNIHNSVISYFRNQTESPKLVNDMSSEQGRHQRQNPGGPLLMVT